MVTNADLLRHYLERADDVCPSCGYALRGLPGDRCPECNQQLVLRVALAEPKLAAFITGLIGVACGLGFSGLLTLYAAYWGLVRGRGGLMPEFVNVFVGLFVSGAALIVLLRCRRWMTRKGAGVRWGMAMMLAGASMVCPLLFIVFVR